ncbi:MAG: hypothetical protein L6V93_20625 [Clostridiales bacterium]|nr:MAG: hypothetical protein L6V93_20625 [Clostridiales bacterium]
MKKIYLMQKSDKLKGKPGYFNLGLRKKSFGGAGGSSTKYSYSTAIGLFQFGCKLCF